MEKPKTGNEYSQLFFPNQEYGRKINHDPLIKMIDIKIKFWLDVTGQAIEVLAIILLSKATAWLQEMGDKK